MIGKIFLNKHIKTVSKGCATWPNVGQPTMSTSAEKDTNIA